MAHNAPGATALCIRQNRFAGPHLDLPSIYTQSTHARRFKGSFDRPLPTEVQIPTSNLLRRFVVVTCSGSGKFRSHLGAPRMAPVKRTQFGLDAGYAYWVQSRYLQATVGVVAWFVDGWERLAPRK